MQRKALTEFIQNSKTTTGKQRQKHTCFRKRIRNTEKKERDVIEKSQKRSQEKEREKI